MRRLGVLAAVVLGLVTAAAVRADPRPWTFIEDVYPEGKGGLEYEQYVTFAGHKAVDHGYKDFQFKHEIEYGVTDKLDLSLYVATWDYEDSAERAGTHYDETAVEGIYYFTSPVTDPVGVAFYTEYAAGEHDTDIENKILFQKDVGNWSFAYNLVVDTGWTNAWNSKAGAEIKGLIGHGFGVSYSLNPTWRVGGELTVETTFAHWDRYDETEVYAGPNVSYYREVGKGHEFWFTVTPMAQLSSVKDAADVEVRMIAGWVF